MAHRQVPAELGPHIKDSVEHVLSFLELALVVIASPGKRVREGRAFWAHRSLKHLMKGRMIDRTEMIHASPVPQRHQFSDDTHGDLFWAHRANIHPDWRIDSVERWKPPAPMDPLQNAGLQALG